MQPSVLVVEDNNIVQEFIELLLIQGGCKHILLASNRDEAENQFKRNKDTIGAVIMDGSLTPMNPDFETGPLIEMMLRENPSLPIVAATGHPDSVPRMLAAGCVRAANPKKKDEAAGIVLEILGIKKIPIPSM
jgi:CheY-like chemotaxis protein